MDPSTRVVGLDAQGNMVFTVVKPLMGIFQVSPEQSSTVSEGGMDLQGLSENSLVLPQTHTQASLDQDQLDMHNIQPHIPPQMEVPDSVQTEDASHNQELEPNSSAASEITSQIPFAKVSSLLDPNMKGSKARKWPSV